MIIRGYLSRVEVIQDHEDIYQLGSTSPPLYAVGPQSVRLEITQAEIESGAGDELIGPSPVSVTIQRGTFPPEPVLKGIPKPSLEYVPTLESLHKTLKALDDERFRVMRMIVEIEDQ